MKLTIVRWSDICDIDLLSGLIFDFRSDILRMRLHQMSCYQYEPESPKSSQDNHTFHCQGEGECCGRYKEALGKRLRQSLK